jgi:hypothetical protein
MTHDTWQQDPQGHEFQEVSWEPYRSYDESCGLYDECTRCGQPQALHTGARIPIDQVMRALPETLAPRLIP